MMKKLYSNIGKKLTTLAMVCGGIGIFCIAVGVIVELLTFFDSFNGILLLSCGLGGLLCLLSSWPLYAFGQLVDDVHQLAGNGSIQASASPVDELPEL
ncbi:hypothetical protein [uncultured Pseudoflavonifractor sp.]|uniref:hypothetical protein n=1 Tax=uncultured Pseudoflavonifractor sp. TaxID=1221379 RepID=UPI0025D5707D|nr:hypothetical protein [uncultured Pseudoflavonifractor sp.]